jgi:hypothetical protein
MFPLSVLVDSDEHGTNGHSDRGLVGRHGGAS